MHAQRLTSRDQWRATVGDRLGKILDDIAVPIGRKGHRIRPGARTCGLADGFAAAVLTVDAQYPGLKMGGPVCVMQCPAKPNDHGLMKALKQLSKSHIINLKQVDHIKM